MTINEMIRSLREYEATYGGETRIVCYMHDPVTGKIRPVDDSIVIALEPAHIPPEKYV